MVLISGGTGEFHRSLGQVLAIALLSSWFFAIAITPALCYWFLPEVSQKAKLARPASGLAALPVRLYRLGLNLLLRWRIAFVLFMVALIISSMLIFSFVKRRSLGPSERNQFTVYVDLPSEASVYETMAATSRLTEFLNDNNENPEVSQVLAYVGSGGPRFFLSLSPNDPQPNKGFTVVSTERAEQIHTVMPRVERFLVEQMPEATGRTEVLALGSSAQGTVEFRVTGDDIRTIRALGARIMTAFHDIDGISGVRNDWENGVIKLLVNIDQDRARRAGVTSEDVARTLSAYFDGTVVTSFREGHLTIPVVMRADSADRFSLDRVRTIEVMSASRGVPVPLLQIADFKGITETSLIRRFNQQRSLTIAGVHPAMTANELYEQLRPEIDEISVPAGYSIELEGEIKESRESNGKLFAYAPHALFVIVLLLVLQFNSLRRTAIILLTIPLVLIGANYGLWAFGGYFDFTAMLGLFSLAGVIINNGIVLIDRIDSDRDEGMCVNDAIVDAALARARPIIMTTATTVTGLVPLALFGGPFWFGMAIVIMCGLAVGTVLTLGFVPVLYSLFFPGKQT